MAAGSRVAVSVDDTVTDGRVAGYEEREQTTRYTMRTDAASEGSCTRRERCAKLADGLPHSTRFNIER
ncbi:hypothetical protein PF003_g21248 [Phytophthora fragariae]|nr:hypothetical protein PF003_g21248 [Phytophthora fragariae]